MEILHIILTSLGSILALFLLTKLIGNRQMSQMSLFDYINGITIAQSPPKWRPAWRMIFSSP